MNIEKIKKKYGFLKVDPFDFPDLTDYPAKYFRDEMEFMSFVLLNEWFQRKIGMCNIKRNIYTPDIEADIIGYGCKILVEVEYHSKSFVFHKHNFWCADLVLSYIRPKNKRTISGIPIWSVYEYDGATESYLFCLPDDINYDFKAHDSPDDYE